MSSSAATARSTRSSRRSNPGPVQVVDSALIALNAELKTFKDRFETELRRKQEESQGVPGMM